MDGKKNGGDVFGASPSTAPSTGGPASVGTPASKPPSGVGNGGGGGGSFGAGGNAFVRSAPVAARAGPGREAPAFDRRLFPGIDVTRGMSRMTEAEVSEEALMTKDEAGQTLIRILGLFGLQNEAEGVIMAFVEMLMLNMAFNGTSVMQPGRAVIKVAGEDGGPSRTFEVAKIVKDLGEDYRRFGRAFADQIRAALGRVLQQRDVLNPIKEDRFEALHRIAATRGMQRYPELAFDTAEYCNGLTLPEVALIANSKQLVLANVSNVPDSLVAMGRAATADGFEGATNAVISDMAGKSATTHKGKV